MPRADAPSFEASITVRRRCTSLLVPPGNDESRRAVGPAPAKRPGRVGADRTHVLAERLPHRRRKTLQRTLGTWIARGMNGSGKPPLHSLWILVHSGCGRLRVIVRHNKRTPVHASERPTASFKTLAAAGAGGTGAAAHFGAGPKPTWRRPHRRRSYRSAAKAPTANVLPRSDRPTRAPHGAGTGCTVPGGAARHSRRSAGRAGFGMRNAR